MSLKYVKSGEENSLHLATAHECKALTSWIRISAAEDIVKTETLPDDLLLTLFSEVKPAGRNWDYFLAFQNIHLNYQESTHVAGEITLYSDRVFLLNHTPRTKTPHTFSQAMMLKHSRLSDMIAPNTALRDEFTNMYRNLSQYFDSYYSGFEALVFPGGKHTWVLRNIISKFMDNAYCQIGERAPRMPDFWEE